jgi:hypothetical protein
LEATRGIANMEHVLSHEHKEVLDSLLSKIQDCEQKINDQWEIIMHQGTMIIDLSNSFIKQEHKIIEQARKILDLDDQIIKQEKQMLDQKIKIANIETLLKI